MCLTLIACYSISASSETAISFAENTTIYGDVTGDGTVNRNDLLRLAKYFSGFDIDINESAADVTYDGTVNRSDLLRLAKYFSGFDVEIGKPVDKYELLVDYILNRGATSNGTSYYLTYTSSGVTYYLNCNKSSRSLTFSSKNPNDHNYSCTVQCYKNSSTQEVFMSYADNGRNIPWGLIETAKFSSGGSLLSYQYDGVNSSRASSYKSVLISKSVTTISGMRQILNSTGLKVTLADLGFKKF